MMVPGNGDRLLEEPTLLNVCNGTVQCCVSTMGRWKGEPLKSQHKTCTYDFF